MRALQEIPIPNRPSRIRGVRRAVSVVGGLLWWGALLRLAVRPDAVEPWQGALAAGGWSLGLIPLHAVPLRTGARPRRSRGDASAS